jgi:F0F1-type ATP synthase assembly protein I
MTARTPIKWKWHVDPRERRELNNGTGKALDRAVELVVTPMVFGFLGYLLDGRLGTRPLFMALFFAIVLTYVIWKQTSGYGAAMDEEQRRIMGDKPETTP